jgi:hypothetical protein
LSLKIGKVINENGEVIETVAYDEHTEEIYKYVLKENETLIKTNIVDVLLKPKWNFEKSLWIETATEAEIKEYEKNIIKENLNTISVEERLEATEKAVADVIMMIGGM